MGAEIDLVLELGRRRVAVECKVSSAPKPARGFWVGLQDLGLEEAYVVAPVEEPYPLSPGVLVLSLRDMLSWASRISAGTQHPAMLKG